MSYEKFLKDNLIKKQKPDFKQISYQLQRALKDLNTAERARKIAHKKIFSFEFFAPFNFLYSTSTSCPSGTSFFEEKQKCQTMNLKRVTNFLPPKSLSGLSADRWCKYRVMILKLLKRLNDLE